MEKKIGIIDLGSNSIRLVIYEIKHNGAYRLVDDISDTVRLSENMIDGKQLNDFAMMRAIKTVKLFKKLCSSYNIPTKNIIAVTTAAVRKAENKDHFLKLLFSSTGLNFRLLSGDEEALYVYKAVIQTIETNDGIIVDIGGGSTEIIKFKDKQVLNHISIPIGSVVATEEFLERDVVAQESIHKLENYIESKLSELSWLTKEKNQVIIGLGGTIRNLAKIHKRQVNYSLDLIHNYTMNFSDFYSLYNNIKTLNLDSRTKVKGLSEKRADIIVGGLSILKVIASYTNSEKLIISGNGLREGVLFEYLTHNNTTRLFTDVLSFSLDNYTSLYGVRTSHASHVCSLTLSIFDQLSSIHSFSIEERKILKVASILHDIGISVNYYGHTDHSFYMILNSQLSGLSHREIILIAAIAASHDKDKFKDDWSKQFNDVLQPTDIKIYKKLSMLLKLGECLDRSETGIISAVECQVSKEIVKIKTIRNNDADLEISLANENAENFKKLFNRQLSIT